MSRKTIQHTGGQPHERWEEPAGTCDGSNTTFTLSKSPFNGILTLTSNATGLSALYSLSDNIITATTAPDSGDTLSAYYRFY